MRRGERGERDVDRRQIPCIRRSLLTDFSNAQELTCRFWGRRRMAGMERVCIHLESGRRRSRFVGGSQRTSRYVTCVARVSYNFPWCYSGDWAVSALFHHWSNPAELMNRWPIEAVNNFDPMKTRRSTSCFTAATGNAAAVSFPSLC